MTTIETSALGPGGRHADWNPTLPIRWVLLDVDGTLVGPTGTVTEVVAEATRALAATGVAVGYATGRNVAGVIDVHQRLGLSGPHVVLNGAQVRQDGRAVVTRGLTDEQLAAVLQLCDAEGLYAELYTDEGFLVTAMDERYRPHWDEVIGQPIGTIETHPPAPGEVIKATIVAHTDAELIGVVDAVTALGLSAGAATSPVTPGLTYVNITRGDVDKGTAILATAEAMGIDASQIAVVGDGANDLPMMGVVGTAIAMGDAPQAVRDAAHLVTDVVLNDGAAVALHDLLAWAVRP
ncbi:HAD family hydrolase [Euzebya rosea]|uniref:HAD family hydrolase n=1 Tax=Euzebya rosea TaxID=2052804 RepID=UPI00130018BC|nr:HAD family hydrolase [Euzebya rosea]